jgi:hypothetical protein
VQRAVDVVQDNKFAVIPHRYCDYAKQLARQPILGIDVQIEDRGLELVRIA